MALSLSKFDFWGETFDLRLPADIEQLVSSIVAAGLHPNLIVLDTLARLTPGAEENSSKDMGEAVRAMDNLRRRFGATVMLVHHTSKNGDSERGSSALRGAADTMIKCSAVPGRLVSLQCSKMKDAEPFASATVTLERVKISPTASSLAVTSWREPGEAEAAHDNAVLKILESKFASRGATHSQLRDEYLQGATGSESSFNRALKALKEAGLVQHDGKMYRSNRNETEGVMCQEVPTRCHDTSAVGVMSSPPLGDDTDTAAPGQK